MKRFPWALTGLAVPALAAGVVGLGGLGRGLAQAPTAAPGFDRPVAPPPGFVPSGPAAAAAPSRQPGPYEVTPQAGAWMVLAASYTGPNAVFLAEQVVRQLRETHRLPAYTWNFANQKRRKEEEEVNRLMKENPNLPYRRRVTRIEEHCGVVVGGYASSDAASAALKKIKRLPPPDVRTPTGEDASDTIILRGEQDVSPGKTQGQTIDRVKVNPFVRAFVIRNPAVPQEQIDQTTKVDPLWKQLNADEKYSLLKCKKKWTLVIKFYQGPGALLSNAVPNDDESFLTKLGFGNKSRQILDATAHQAHELAKFLRQCPRPRTKGTYQAYVLHTRHGSIVTVGGFDSDKDKEMQAIQQELASLRMNWAGGQPLGTAHDLFAQPMPMRVPKL